VLTAYIHAAMHHARYVSLPEDSVYYGEIPELPGVWASAPTQKELPETLREVLEGWIALELSLGHAIPPINGCAITVASVA
jgi:predicted RNase H-like HicB family nuclease